MIGNPMGAFVYPRGLIGDWKNATADSIDASAEHVRRSYRKTGEILRTSFREHDLEEQHR